VKITREQLRRWGACYEDERIAALVPEAGLTPLEVANLYIPAEDRLWVLLRKDIIPARELRLLVCDWAEAACRAAGWNDARSLEAIAVARRFALGEASEAELAEARSAAWSAAWAWSAAAARSAALSAAAWSPRWAWAAAWAAAEAEAPAAWSAKLADVVRVLRKIEGGKKE
jgi:hypothetical protein